MKAESEPSIAKPNRDLAIDRIRGALVILMVAGDFAGGVNWVPAFLKHAPDIGFTIADTVAPIFVFLIGLNFGPSFTRRLSHHRVGGYRHFFTRYLSLTGIGAIISAGADLADRPEGWGVLQSLGVAGLLTLIFIKLPIWARFVSGLVILCGYQYLLDAYFLENVLGSGHGGFFGAISWTALLILSTAVADIWRKGMKPFLVCNAALIAAATISAFIVPVSKNRVSLSYILISLAMSSLVFLIVKALSRFSSEKEGLLCWWGKNSLALYLLHLLVLSVFGLPPAPWWYVEATPWLSLVQLAGVLAFLSFLAWRISHYRFNNNSNH